MAGAPRIPSGVPQRCCYRLDDRRRLGIARGLSLIHILLDLMDEYPEFKFSQSQASTYKIVEDYGPPHMLERIAQRAQEGRWEPTTATWVEADKNTPNAESMARHLLYTRRYISKLLGIDGKKLQLDFEPDTFGHSANLPEILSAGGVRYYYHCRGDERTNLYRWRGLSGAEVLCYRCLLYTSRGRPSGSPTGATGWRSMSAQRGRRCSRTAGPASSPGRPALSGA